MATPYSQDGSAVTEYRVDQADGRPYTEQQFVQYYGVEEGTQRFASAPRISERPNAPQAAFSTNKVPSAPPGITKKNKAPASIGPPPGMSRQPKLSQPPSGITASAAVDTKNCNTNITFAGADSQTRSMTAGGVIGPHMPPGFGGGTSVNESWDDELPEYMKKRIEEKSRFQQQMCSRCGKFGFGLKTVNTKQVQETLV